ncbi:MAG: hypothetical protein AB1486_07515 [Planctomycetota bacterium]
MMTLIKYGLIAAVLAGAAFLFLGPERVKSLAHEGKQMIEEKISDVKGFESELNSVNQKVRNLDQEIRNLRREVIERKVDVGMLRETVDKKTEELASLRRNIEKASELLAEDAAEFVIGGRHYTRREVELDAEVRFKEYQAKEETLHNLQQTLGIKENSLQVAEENVARANHLRAELEGKVRLLAARLERLRAREVYAESADYGIATDELKTELGAAQAMIRDFEKKLEVRDRMLDERLKVGPGEVGRIDYDSVTQNDTDIATQIRRYFMPETVEKRLHQDAALPSTAQAETTSRQ